MTNQHVVETSEYLAVQFDPGHKVAAKLLAADSQKDVAVLWADLSAFPEAVIAPIAKAEAGSPPIVEGERVFTIGSPLNQRKILTTGVVSKVEPHTILSDVNINPGSSGGPLFNSVGSAVGITTFGEQAGKGPGIAGIVRIEEALPLLEQARAKMAGTAAPAATLLPVEPKDPCSVDAIKEVLRVEKFDNRPYFFDIGDYDVAIYTPPLDSRQQFDRKIAAAREKEKRNKKKGESGQEGTSAADEIKKWSEDVGEFKSVIEIRARPKLKQKFWASYGSAMAGGPSKMRFKTDFYRMRLLCGSKEVPPIHPGRFRVIGGRTATVDITDTTYVGFYSYLPDAIAPSCGQVVVELYAAKDSAEPTVKTLDPATVERIWSDFEPYRKAPAASPEKAAPAKN
jgi:hypothetical protein